MSKDKEKKKKCDCGEEDCDDEYGLYNPKYIYPDQLRRILLRENVVIFTGEVDNDSVELPVRELEVLHRTLDMCIPVYVILESVGGDVYPGLYVYNTIRKMVNEGRTVDVEARGLAASMGAIILQSGSKRIAPKATRILIHEVCEIGFDSSKVTEKEEQVKELRALNNMLRDIISERSGHPKEEIDKVWTKKDVWYSAVEAKRYNLIDEVI